MLNNLSTNAEKNQYSNLTHRQGDILAARQQKQLQVSPGSYS